MKPTYDRRIFVVSLKANGDGTHAVSSLDGQLLAPSARPVVRQSCRPATTGLACLGDDGTLRLLTVHENPESQPEAPAQGE